MKNRRKAEGNYRTLQLKPNLIDFASNDYLGVSSSSQLKQALAVENERIQQIGSTGSRLLTGNSLYVEELERSIASFHGFGEGLIFNCGYMANLGVINALIHDEAVILFDCHIHASVRDGMHMARAKAYPFRHNDLDHLEKRLKTLSKRGRTYICVESIYSTDGTVAPLREILVLSQKYGARLIVDEAHAIGVCGDRGQGLVFQLGLAEHVYALVVTFGKAVGVFGAIVLSDRFLKEKMVNFSKPFIYTTALPFPILAAIKCSYRLFPGLHAERERLQELIRVANYSATPIQPIYVGGNQEAHSLVRALMDGGYDVRALLSPTVQKGSERLRVVLHAFNTKADLVHLLQLVRLNG